jgi:hypothetical protein
MSWSGAEKVLRAGLRTMATSQAALTGDVAFYYLPHVRIILEEWEKVRIVCLKRDRAATVASLLAKAGKRHFWANHDGREWEPAPKWDKCFPKYEGVDRVRAVEAYWDDYYRSAEQWERDYAGRFRIFSTESLSTESGQKAILNFVGLAADDHRYAPQLHLNQGRTACRIALTPDRPVPIPRAEGVDPGAGVGAPSGTNRIGFLNQLIRHFKFRSYLEIGCGDDRTFDRVAAADKVGVDPVGGGTLRMTSDHFFKVNRKRFDLIFIDGLHLREQVLRDVANALRALRSGGCIVLHDCLPKTEMQQARIRRTKAWTGDVWKAVAELRTDPDLDVAVADADWGLGVVVPRPNSDPLRLSSPLTWDDYVRDRARLLRVMDSLAVIDFVRGVTVREPDGGFHTVPG